MPSTFRVTLVLALFISSTVSAQVDELSLCKDELTEDRQPEFTAAGFDRLGAIEIVDDNGNAKLRLNTNLNVLNTELIILPFDQNLQVSFIQEGGGASATLGWFFYDELVARGYVNLNDADDPADDVLLDADGSGIADFHEDLFKLSTAAGRTIGTRRCNTTFNYGGKTFYEPEMAIHGCNSSFNGSNWVGRRDNANTTNFRGDNGLYPYIPNLLEPSDPLNDNKGVGHIVFLITDDDGDTSNFGFGAVPDVSWTGDGTPDYDVSAYDSNGKPLATNPNVGISAYDRTVDLGKIPGHREMVFFTIVYYNGGGNSCLKASGASCQLGFSTPVSVFFSKSMLNLDLETTWANPVFQRDIGCPIDENNTNVQCTSGIGTHRGWIDQGALDRLDNNFSLEMPHELAQVPRPAHNRMPHMVLGAPSTQPHRWILGFEDLNEGGDRDYNDTVFLIHKSNGGEVQSGIVSGDISPSIAEDFTITKVRFKRVDDFTESSWHEAVSGACAATPLPSITYQLAVDCKVCTAGCGTTNPVWSPNPTPQWADIVFPTGESEVVLDMLALGFTGSQLCWRAIMTSPNEHCQPTIHDVEVGYQAVRAGHYAKASVSTLANAMVYGTYETPGKELNPAPTTRRYDNRKDYSLRGHFFFRSLYEPEDPETTHVVEQWNAGRVLTDLVRGGADPLITRKLYTMDDSGNRVEVKDVLSVWPNVAMPADYCGNAHTNAGVKRFDLNRSGDCDASDSEFLSRWLYGWEDATHKRGWAMGPINMSTAALVSAPTFPAWYYAAPQLERDAYKSHHFSDAALSGRPTVAYVASASGVLHAIASGQYQAGDDTCTSSTTEHRGFFAHHAGCGSRNYGTGEELFAYLPRKLLNRYANNYVGRVDVAYPLAMMDASPAFAEVDLGDMNGTDLWIRGLTDPDKGAKTVLVSPTGPNQSVVFALDISDPQTASQFPVPMWELDLQTDTFDIGPHDRTIQSWFAAESAPYVPDTKSSRHHPSIVRMEFGEDEDPKWVTVVTSDFKPDTGAVGTVYLIDLKTGRPVELDNGNSPEKRFAGVITLAENSFDVNEGIGGPAAAVDVNRNGSYDVLYVPSTSGKVYRINTTSPSLARPLGQVLQVCRVASAPAAIGGTEATLQRIYSNLAIKLDTTHATPSVKFYFGTANDPDDPFDAEATTYHVLAFEDTDPLGTTCTEATLSWKQELDPGQVVWGGVTINQESVFSATAVGKAADACNLDDTQSGKFYSFVQSDGDPNPGSATDLGGHATTAPVIHDEHLMITKANATIEVKGKEKWNNPTTLPGAPGTTILLWEVRSNAKLPSK